MKKFSEYNIVPKGKFLGDKIKITKILKKEVYEDILKRKTESYRKCA